MDDIAESAQHHREAEAQRGKALGFGGRSAALQIWPRHIPKLSRAIWRELERPSRSKKQQLIKDAVRRLRPRAIAQTALWAFVSAIANRGDDKSDAVVIKEEVGHAIVRECDFARMQFG